MRIAGARYPTRLEVSVEPGLLERHIPPTLRAAAGMAGVTVLLLASPVAGGNTSSHPVAPKAPAIAPIFDHGEGRGSTGCIAIAPPVFLSEEEALSAIKEEMLRHGVALERGERPVGRASLNRLAVVEDRKNDDPCWRDEHVEQRERLGPFRADLQDRARRVVVEFVSGEDHQKIFGPSGSTVTDYRTREIAEWVDKWVEEGGARVYFGAFYDPLVPWRRGEELGSKRMLAKERPSDPDGSERRLPLEKYENRRRLPLESVARGDARENESEEIRAVYEMYERQERELRAEARMLLRHQVRDFVKWLEAQGAI